MERQFFDYKLWDDIGFHSIQCYDCVLKVPIANYEVGHKFDTIVIDYDLGFIQLHETDDGTYREFSIRLSLGEEIIEG
jgi:hypothetical protein